MKLEIQAIFENGLLRPLEPLALSDQQLVTVTVDTADAWYDEEIHAEAATRAGSIPSLDACRTSLASIRGSLGQFVIDERGEF